ncbi:translation initiation factor IF-2 [Streptomyces sp. 150FB]|uniref:helix-turn-helix transcriptional regulator n=1 Tax=Streptomyces sp. 150FB TaxID=1576605 RepID=UPI000588FFA6|nr:AraC family transcriptional regulator [Streptomyces sp. 150FB]KIF78207.1 translation initiation factor IF-2 [Streptomyces sp. 150FB]
MVTMRNSEVADLAFWPTAGAPPGVEVFRCSALPPRAERHGVDPHSALRPDFHQLIVVRSGTLRCSVDFTDHVLTDGHWLWIRPGQVRQYRSSVAEAEGTMVLFQSDYLDAAAVRAARLDEPGPGRPLDLRGARGTTERDVLALLQRQHDSPSTLPPELYAATMRHLLAVLVLRLAHAAGRHDEVRRGGEAFQRFRLAVESDFARTRRVEDYAQLLGYSVRTLTRVTHAAVGCAAKRFIDDRVLLEAKRLLVHTGLAARTVGERLGFSEATTFARFFRRRTGMTPADFRDQARGVTASPPGDHV